MTSSFTAHVTAADAPVNAVMPVSLSLVFCSTFSVATPVAALSVIVVMNTTPSQFAMSSRVLLLSVLLALETAAPT